VSGGVENKLKSARKRWPWVVAGIGITLVCLLAFLIRASRADKANGSPVSTSDPLTAEQVDVPTLEPALLQNPDRHFERANLLLDEERPLLAAEEFIRAGELYLRQNQFTEAATSFWRAYQASPTVLQRTRDVSEAISEAFFLATADPAAWPMIEQFVKAQPEWSLLPVINARTRLFQGATEEARAEVMRVLEGDPSNHYALAVLAEIQLQTGERAEAERIIEKELSRPDELPSWLFNHLQSLKPKP
jgi:tetratricopeptide (TPR) repeat protein